MSHTLPAISGKDFIKFLEQLGFRITRINGSHHRMKHEDGRVTTVPFIKMMTSLKDCLEKSLEKILK
jgi:predicted RNA binding protein YcfA (HicA-like mRNA interferase family)